MGGCSAHPNNWYCPVCDDEEEEARLAAKKLEKEINGGKISPRVTNLLKYFNKDFDEGDITYDIKKGYSCRYEGFQEFNIIHISFESEGILFMTEQSDWIDTIPKGLELLEECKIYKIEEISL